MTRRPYLVKGYLCVWNANGRVRPGAGIHYPFARLLWEEAWGIVLPRSWVVHHRNGEPLDNRIGNLEALPRSEHPKRHRTHQRDGERLCGKCDEWKETDEFYAGQKRCKPCQRVAQRERRARSRAVAP